NRLPEWMRLYYQGSDKQLLSDAIAIDHAINQAFYRATLSPLAALERRAKLQPHVSLFRLEHNLFQVRDHLQLGNSCLVKKQDKASFFLVYRSRQLHIKWEEISEAEHTLLSQFQT